MHLHILTNQSPTIVITCQKPHQEACEMFFPLISQPFGEPSNTVLTADCKGTKKIATFNQYGGKVQAQANDGLRFGTTQLILVTLKKRGVGKL